MITIRPDILYVRDPATGKFVPLVAIKGEAGDIESISKYLTNDTGDSETLAMTQKGVTAIKTALETEIGECAKKSEIPEIPKVDLSPYAKTLDLTNGNITVKNAENATYANSSVNAGYDYDGNYIPDTYAKKSEIPSGGDVDLSEYAKKTDIPDLTDYAKKTDIPDVSDYAKKSDIPDLTDYAKKSAVTQLQTDIETGQVIPLDAHRATSDGNGNTIHETYVTKAELQSILDRLSALENK